MKAPELKIPFVWKDRHPVFLDRCLYIPDFYDLHDKWQIVPFCDPRFFGNDLPISVEYCSGNGRWICNQAKQHPDRNWVAVEKRFDRARLIRGCAYRENIPNVFVVCGEGVLFTEHYVQKKSVSEMFVNFPDPWPKLRHAKHRLVRSEFIRAAEEVLVPKSRVMFTTDDLPYVSQMSEVIALHSRWRPLLPPPHFTTTWPDFGASYFLDLWKKKGRDIHYLPFEVDV